MTLPKSMLDGLEQCSRERLAEIKEVIIKLQDRKREIDQKLALAWQLHSDAEKSIEYWAKHPDRYRKVSV